MDQITRNLIKSYEDGISLMSAQIRKLSSDPKGNAAKIRALKASVKKLKEHHKYWTKEGKE